MNRLIKIFRTLLYFMVLGPLPLLAQLNVVHINNESVPPSQEGIFYALPRTVINIEVQVDRVENYKGPYSDYAQRFLGLKNIIESNAVEYKINSVTITTSAEPDPEEYYFISTGAKPSKSEKAGILSLTESGLILGTIPAEQKVIEKEIIRTDADYEAQEKDIFPEVFRYYADMSVFEKIDTIIKKVSIDTMTMERQYLKRTMVEKLPEQKAKEAADYITKIKENRFNLISGYQEVNYNKETLEYMDEQLKMLEREYLKLFTGISLHKTLTFQFKYVPVPNQINVEFPVFRFSRAKGVTDLDASGGKIITVKLQRVGNTNVVNNYLNRASKATKESGFFYRIPELARVSVKLDDGTTEETQCLVNQLGVVTFLPAPLRSVEFHESTGGIKSLILE